MKSSATLEEEIRLRAEWLETFYPRIVGCRVLVERPHRHRAHGNHVHVRVELSLPGEDVVVSHAPMLRKDAVTTIHDAFAAARRRLQDAARQQRGDVKTRAGAAGAGTAAVPQRQGARP